MTRSFGSLTACILVLALTAAGSSCSDDGQSAADAAALDGEAHDAEAQPDAAPDAESGLPLPEPGGDGHADVAAALGEGQVRAGKITDAAQLLSGIKATGRVGDFKIYNDRVAFIIAGARASDGYSSAGGEVLDAQRLDDPQAGGSLLGEVVLTIGFDVLEATSVTVVEDGSDGQRALVRVIGELRPFAYVKTFLPSAGGSHPADVVVDYILEPGSDALRIEQRFFARGEHAREIPLSAAALIGGDGAAFFVEDDGFDIESLAKRDWVGWVGDAVSYALLGSEGQLQPLVTYEGLWIVSSGSLTLPPRVETVRRFALGVGEGTPEGLRRLLRRLTDTASLTPVSGTVRDPDGAPVAGARVHVQRADGRYVTMARSDDGGRYAVELSAGNYDLFVVSDGRELQDAVSATVDTAPVTKDLQAGGSAELTFSVADGDGQQIPAKLAFTRTPRLTEPPPTFGERRYPHGRSLVVMHRGGARTLRLPPGEYAVTVSRGFEYEIDTATLTLAAGDAQSVSFELVRSVDTTGYMSGDFHLHAMWSPDSDDLYEHKASAFVAEGLEIAVATDHEYIADYTPYIAKLGMQKWVRGLVGEEITTLVYGHFNPFPIEGDDSKPNRGALDWQGRAAPQMFEDVRKRWPDAVLQVNHPRTHAIGGYLTYVGYDPATGSVADPGGWSTNFDAMELVNGGRIGDSDEATIADWYSMLDRGFRVTGTGNSDSHEAYGSEVGYPRNFVRLPTDEPAQLAPADLAAAVRGQRLVVSGGPFVVVSVAGKGPGEVAAAESGQASLQVRVQAPQWMKLDRLRVISNGGEMLYDLPLDAGSADPANPAVRYDAALPLAVAGDAWIVVRVDGAQAMAPIYPGKYPFAISNPIFLDVDGNGVYDPPEAFP